MTQSAGLRPSAMGTAELVAIEDDPSDQLLLREILDNGKVVGMRLRLADSLSAGEALIGPETLCVLLDNVMPDGLGLDIIERIREHWPDIALIMMTGSGDEMTSVEALKKGADDYLPKSKMTPTRLADTILDAVDKKKLAQTVRAKNDELSLLVQLMDSAEDMLFVVDCSRDAIVQANVATKRALANFGSEDQLHAIPVSRLFKSGYAGWAALKNLLNRGSPARYETVVNSGGFQGRPVEVSARLVFQSGTQFVIGVARDISGQKRLQAELLENASIDPQTELPTLSALRLQLEARHLAEPADESDWLLIGVGSASEDSTLASGNSLLDAHVRVRLAEVVSQFANLHQGHPCSVSPKVVVVAVPEVDPDQSQALLQGLRAELDRQLSPDSEADAMISTAAMAAVRTPLSKLIQGRPIEVLQSLLTLPGARRDTVLIEALGK